MGYDLSRNWLFGGASGDSAYLSMSYTQTFDANNNITSNVGMLANGTPNSNTLYFYNASNMMTKSLLQYWGGTSWVSNIQHLFSYYPTGKLALDTAQVYSTLTSSWGMYAVRSYFYDGSMNLVNETDDTWTSGSPVHYRQWSRTYSSTNQLLTTTYSLWMGSGWVNNTMYTHDYDASTGNPISLLFQNYNTGTAAWDNTSLYLFSNYNSSNLPQTMVYQTWDATGTGAWVNNKQYTYAYNSYNQLTNAMGISWNATSGLYQRADGDPVDNYHYELYGPTSVATVNGVSFVNVYPVPAQNNLHIDLTWAEAQSATISIIDVTGSVVRNLEVASGVRVSSNIPVGNLASGTYFVKISGQKGQIVKQIVVAH